MNVGLFLSRTARRLPERLGVVCGDTLLTWAEVDRRANGFATALRQLGVAKGGRVAIVLPNCHQYIEVLFGAFKAGATVVPMNLKLHPKEVAYHTSDAGAQVLVVHSDLPDQVRAATKEHLPTVEHVVAVGSENEGTLSYERLVLDCATAEEQAEDMSADDLAWLFYTSGTTGRPKGAMLTHGNLTAMTVGMLADMAPLTKDDVTLHCSPLSHGAGLFSLPPVARGAKTVILPKFDAAEVIATVEAEGITFISTLVPTQIRMILNSPAIGSRDTTTLRRVIYGGAPMYAADVERAVRALGQVWIQLYGQGESPMTGTVLPADEHVIEGSGEQVARVESAGVARTDIEIRILDEDDAQVPTGVPGEICLRGPTVMKGYWERPEESAETLKNGWLHTGDIGHLDEAGYLFIVDRSKDMIISGGMNIYPREIEEVLQRHEAVYECAVIGVPDPKWGEAVKAVVVLRPDAECDEDTLIDFCASQLSSFKKPKSVDFIDDLPKSAYGKILKRELRSRYWEGSRRTI